MTPISPAHGRLFTAVEAAAYLGISVGRVRTLLATSELVALRKPCGRLEGVYQADCDAWVEARRAVPAPARSAAAVDVQVATLPGAGHFA